MSWLDQFKPKPAATSPLATRDDDLPNLASAPASPSLGQLLSKDRPTVDDENEGLPAVNRMKSGNRAVTLAGYVVIALVGLFLIIAVNRPKKVQVKKAGSEDNVANRLPPFVQPDPPPALALAPAPQPAVTQANYQPANANGRPAPIPLQGGRNSGNGTSGAYPNNAGGPPKPTQIDWITRKMSGGILAGSAGNAQGASENGGRSGSSPLGTPGGGFQPVSLQGGSEGGYGGAGGAGGLGSNGGNYGAGTAGVASTPGNAATADALTTKLTPSITTAVTASLLPDRNFLITKGTALDCALETAINTGLPGITTCRLTRDIYSDNGQVLLLDRGSKLVGEYQGGIRQGQVRVFVLWTRAETPNGVVINLNSPGADALGRAGLDGFVDNHFLQRFGAAILLSLVNSTVQALATQSGNNSVNYSSNTGSAGERVVESVLNQSVNIPPTIVKNQGDEIQVMVARDLDFATVYGLRPR